MMSNFSRHTSMRPTTVDGVGPWHWVNSDSGAWDGPVDDWLTSHKRLYLELVENRRCVVQAGGNLGLYPRLLSELFDVVYTFEPDPLNFHHLVLNCQRENIIKIQAAVGYDLDPVIVERLTMENVGMHRVVKIEHPAIPQLRIDFLNLRICDLIALDVEGYEFNALRGAEETIDRCKPVIATERPTSDVAEFMRRMGYKAAAESKMDVVWTPRPKKDATESI